MDDIQIISSIGKKASAVLEEMTGTLIEPIQFMMDLDAYTKERHLRLGVLEGDLRNGPEKYRSRAILELLMLSQAIDKTVNFGENDDDPMVSLGKEYGRVNKDFTSYYEYPIRPHPITRESNANE